MGETVYLDYAATTPLDPRVRDAMLASMGSRQGFGNPSSVSHSFGAAAMQVAETAAEQVSSLVHCRPQDVIWTSGATESDNLAILGAAQFREMRGRHIVTTAIEHKAVLESCRWLETQGYDVSYVQPDADGIVTAAAVAAELRPDTTLVSVMHANNETGVVQDIAAIGDICRRHDAWFHVDAAQSAGKLAIDMGEQQVDLLSVNAHKACGPKGVGALCLNADRVRRVAPLLHGGGQQRGIRPGTLAVHQIAGMGQTFAILAAEMEAEVLRVASLRDRLWQTIADIPQVFINGSRDQRLCSILNVSVGAVEGESLRFALSDLAVSSGSACNSAVGEPSYVLRSLGRSDALVEASIRFSLGRFSSVADVDVAAQSFRNGVEHLRLLGGGLAVK